MLENQYNQIFVSGIYDLGSFILYSARSMQFSILHWCKIKNKYSIMDFTMVLKHQTVKLLLIERQRRENINIFTEPNKI